MYTHTSLGAVVSLYFSFSPGLSDHLFAESHINIRKLDIIEETGSGKTYLLLWQ
jgi:hypothetical protein